MITGSLLLNNFEKLSKQTRPPLFGLTEEEIAFIDSMVRPMETNNE
jgi:hypothetical protein